MTLKHECLPPHPLSYTTYRSQEVQYSLIHIQDGTSPSEMLPLLQEQGEPQFFQATALPHLWVTVSCSSPWSLWPIYADWMSFLSHIPNLDSTVVCQIPKSASSISAASEPTLMTSLSASIWFPTSTSNCLRKRSRLHVSAPTSTLILLSFCV